MVNKIRYLILITTLVACIYGFPTNTNTNHNNEAANEEQDGDSSRKIIGQSVVTSVSVVMNGEQPQFTDAIGQVVPRPLVPPQVASPIELLTPDRYEFYTFNDAGDLIKRLMTIKEIQSIVAGGDSEGALVLNSQQPNNEAQQKVQDIVDSVQNVLTTEMETKKNFTIVHPVLDTPDVSSSWNMILPAIFGNTGDEIVPHKPQQIVMTPDSTIVETTNKPIRPIYTKPNVTKIPATSAPSTPSTAAATTAKVTTMAEESSSPAGTTTALKATKLSSTSSTTAASATATTAFTTSKPKTTARAPINQVNDHSAEVDGDGDEAMKTKNEPVSTVAFQKVDIVTTTPEMQANNNSVNKKTTKMPSRKPTTIASSPLPTIKNGVASTVKESTTSQTTATATTTQKPATTKTSKPMTTASLDVQSTTARPQSEEASTSSTAATKSRPTQSTTEAAIVSTISRKPSAPIQQKKEEFIDIQTVAESLMAANGGKLQITTEQPSVEITTTNYNYDDASSEEGSTERYEYVTKFRPDMKEFTTLPPTETTTMMMETQDAINQIIGTLQFNNPNGPSLMFNNYPIPMTTAEPDYGETEAPMSGESGEYVEATTEKENSVNELEKIPSSHVFVDNTLYIEEQEPIVEAIPTTTPVPEAEKLATYNSFESSESSDGRATTTGKNFETTERFFGMTEQLIHTTNTPDQLYSESVHYTQNNEVVQLVDRYIEANKDHDIEASFNEKNRDVQKIMGVPQIKENRTMSQYKEQAATVASIMAGDNFFDLTTTPSPMGDSAEEQQQEKAPSKAEESIKTPELSAEKMNSKEQERPLLKNEKISLANNEPTIVKNDRGPAKTEIKVNIVTTPYTVAKTEAATETSSSKSASTTTTFKAAPTTERIVKKDSKKTTAAPTAAPIKSEHKETMIEVATSKPDRTTTASTEILNESFTSLITQIINEDPSLVEDPTKLVIEPFFHNDITPVPEVLKTPEKFHEMEALSQVKNSTANKSSEKESAVQNDATAAVAAPTANTDVKVSANEEKETTVVKTTSSVSTDAPTPVKQQPKLKPTVKVNIQQKSKATRRPVVKVTKESSQTEEDDEEETVDEDEEEEEEEDDVEEDADVTSEEVVVKKGNSKRKQVPKITPPPLIAPQLPPQVVTVQIIQNNTKAPADDDNTSDGIIDRDSEEGVITGITSDILGAIGAVDESALFAEDEITSDDEGNEEDDEEDEDEEAEDDEDQDTGASKQDDEAIDSSKQENDESSAANDDTDEEQDEKQDDDDEENDEDVSTSIASEILDAASTIADSDEGTEENDEDEDEPIKYVVVKRPPIKITKIINTTPRPVAEAATIAFQKAGVTKSPQVEAQKETVATTVAPKQPNITTTLAPTSNEDSSISFSDFIPISAETSTESETFTTLITDFFTGEDDSSSTQATKIQTTTATPAAVTQAKTIPNKSTKSQPTAAPTLAAATSPVTIKSITERIPVISGPISQSTITKKVGNVPSQLSGGFVNIPDRVPVKEVENNIVPVAVPSIKVESIAPQKLVPESQKMKADVETATPTSATSNVSGELPSIVRKDDSSEVTDFEGVQELPTEQPQSETKYVQLGETTTPSAMDVETTIRVSTEAKPLTSPQPISEKVKKDKIPTATKVHATYPVNRPSVIKQPPPSLQALKNSNNLKVSAAQATLHSNANPAPIPFELKAPPKDSLGLEQSILRLNQDVKEFTNLCNELAFNFWQTLTSEGNGVSTSRSIIASPYAVISQLAMVFLGARGLTSFEMNELLKLDEMVTFNPHVVFRNITDSVELSKNSGSVATAAFVRELYSDRSKGKLLNFFKEKSQQYYSSHVEEINFGVVNDIIRRRTNLLVKRHTNGKINEYLKTNNIWLNPPLAAISANIFETDCSKATFDERDGEMFFQVSPAIRQRRLIPVPAAVWRSDFIAGFDVELDATAVAFGASPSDLVSTIFVMPGQQGHSAPGDNLERLEKTFMDKAIKEKGWKRLLTSLMERPGLEVQLPRFSHKSLLNLTSTLQRMGLKNIFNSERADLRGISGSSIQDLYFSDMYQVNTFSTCGESKIGDQHHVEIYPAPALKRSLVKSRSLNPYLDNSQKFDETHDYQRALLLDPIYDNKYSELPLSLRPRQARLPETPRLKFDRPFLYFVRHNPTGMLLFMGRFNPRLLP